MSSDLQHRMNKYEVIPPTETWDKIAAALDESALDSRFPARLYEMESTPPALAWENINSSLQSSAPVIPMQKRRNSFLRYAAAAVLIGFSALGIIKWTTGNTDTQGISTTEPGSSKTTENTAKTGTLQPADRALVPKPDEKDLKPENETRELIAQVEQPGKSRSHKTNRRSISTANYNYNPAIEEEPANPLYAYEDHVPNLTDRYITLFTPEGNIIRMSKKWSSLVCCVSGEEQDADCKNQLKKWQEKIASSPLAPSPGNFMDILNLVNSLDDNGTEL